ncbi:hypothetical protein GQ53DRAFT_82027 [Thozetella sp. PMI_491]|nr:hypothetical protein GQ53DRAFT_82027 [Thozetella sp. PMI_491]
MYRYNDTSQGPVTRPDEELETLITIDHVKELIQELIEAVKSSTASILEKYGVTEQQTVPDCEQRLVEASEKLVTHAKQPVREHILPFLSTSVALPRPSPATTPPSSPDERAVVRDLVQTAIRQAKSLLPSQSLWEGAFGPNLVEHLISTLEKIQTVFKTDTPASYAPEPNRASNGDPDLERPIASNFHSTCPSLAPSPPSSPKQTLAKQVRDLTLTTDVMRVPFAASYTIGTLVKPKDVDTLASLPEESSRIPSKDPTPPSSSNSSDTGEDENDEKGKSNSQLVLASRLEYKRVDEIWVEKRGKYDIVEPTDLKHDKLDEFLFIVRERTDKSTLEKVTFIDIKSTWIRDILREICRDHRNVSLADNKPSIELNALFHVRAALQQHKKVITTGSAAEKHLDVLLRYLDATFQPTDDRLSVLLAEGRVTYDLLWALFQPNAEVYTTCRGTKASRCLLFTQIEERKDIVGSKYMHLESRYIGSDGKVLGEVTTSSAIPIFRGERRIDSLTAYPLQYHPEKDDIRKQLEECGRKYVSLLGIHHRKYTGKAFDYDEKANIVALHVEGNIMVDFECFHENMPNYPSARVQQMRHQYSVLGRCEVLKPANVDPTQLKLEEFLICSPTVLGFSFEKKRFLEFAVAYTGDVEWSECSFEDVKIPIEQKKAILALTKTYLDRKPNDGFHDLVQGKGLGYNFLLYGPPGVGKTLTAETLAETFKAPLYTVAAGQIGVDHVRVEKFLKTIFKIASRWHAILLLDEADVFLAERALNPHTNALVSVFLRELEHFDGILFLTTNRMQTFDPAIMSRIHLPLRYNPLSREAREAVWRCFLEQARTEAGPAIYSDKVLAQLVDKKLNGREIRNTVLVARSMAKYDNKAVDETYLKASIAARKQLDEDFQGAGAVENNHSYI